MKKVIAGLLLLLSSLLYAQSELKKVTLQLSWFDQFQFAGYYIAKEKGFYEKEGLDVQIIPFEFGLHIPQDISSRKIDFAVGRETLIIEKANGLDIVALYALFQSSPLVFISLENSGILTVKDFQNKKVMATIDDSSEVSLKAMLNSHGVDKEDYTFIQHTHNVNDLIDKKVDVISAYTSKAPYELEKKGLKYTIHSPNYYGFDMYSDLLFTSQKLINSDITTVTAFKRASLQGWEYAYNHIEESAHLILNKYNKQKLSKEELVFEGNELKKLSYYQTNKLGNIDKSKLQRIHDLYNVMGFIPQAVNLNEFLFGGFDGLKPVQKEYLAQKKELKVCSTINYLPFAGMIDGKHTGLLHHFLNKISDTIRTPFSLVPASSLVQMNENFDSGRCDIVSLAFNTNQTKNLYNTTSSYMKVPLVVATSTDKIFISDLKDLKEKKVGYLEGLMIKEILAEKYPEVEFIPFKETKEGLEVVQRGKIYGFIDALPAISYLIQKDYSNSLKITGKVDAELGFSLGVAKNDVVLFRILESVLEQIDEKEKANLLSEWINVKYEIGFDYSLFWKILFVLAVIFIAFYMRFRVIQSYNSKIEKNLKIIDRYVLYSKTDLKGIITEVSEALCRLTGYAKQELIGQPQNIFRHPDVPKEVFRNMWDTIQKGETWSGEFPNLSRDGSTYWIHAKITPIYNKAGEIEGYSAFRQDVTDKKRIEEISVTDQLTQLSNRLFLDRFYEKEINKAKRYGTIFSLIIVDIDYFKEVNDTHGHYVGDKVLFQIAKVLQNNVRDSDCLGRWGGEEFLIICPETTQEQATVLAEKLKEKIDRTHFEVVGRKTCSFGVASFQKGDKGFETLHRADQALYKAKSAGRDRVETF